MRSLSLSRVYSGALLAVAACSSFEGAAVSEDELVDSRIIGTYRKDNAKDGELRSLALKGDQTAAVVMQECVEAGCTSVERTGTYELSDLKDGERRLDLRLGDKTLAYRARPDRSSFTIDMQSLALLEIDPATGQAIQPIVSFTLQHSNELWCSTPKDCDLQGLRAERGPAVDCVAATCSWNPSNVCTLDPTTAKLTMAEVGGGAPAGRTSAAGAWAGERLFVFGGRSADQLRKLSDGGLFDPKTNKWKALSTAGAPSAREFAKAAGVRATGKVVLVGGLLDGPDSPRAEDGYVYDVQTDKWDPLVVPSSISASWWGELFATDNAVFRVGSKHFYQVDLVARKVVEVPDPPGLSQVLSHGPVAGMTVATPTSFIRLYPLPKAADYLSGVDHTIWRMFERNSFSNEWTVSDVGLGPIDKPTTITYSAGSLVLLSGENARTGGSGIVAVVDLASKKAHVVSIGGGAAPSSSNWLWGYGGSGSPVFTIVDAKQTVTELDTLDVARHRWVHRGVGAGRPSLAGTRTFDVRVWTGSELLIWGGVEKQTVNGFEVTTYPQQVVRYSPARCP